MRVVVVGAGIIGAAIAWNLNKAGHRVTVIDRGMPGQGASARSFGWLNASFFADAMHFRLRVAGMVAWQRLGLGMDAVRWPGCLWWEETGRGFYDMHQSLAEMNYVVRDLDAAEVRRLEPGLAQVPDRALYFQTEGIADLATAVRALLQGSSVISGVEVRALTEAGGRIAGVETSAGRIKADAVVLAAGTGVPELLAPLGVSLPMLDRPGLLMRTAPVEPLARHILAVPGQELRQDADGRIVAPTSPSHQSDASETIGDSPEGLADRALARISALFGRNDLVWDEVSVAMRPVPGDGLPVVGSVGPEGLYVAVMHSGATLAAVVGELAAAELSEQGASPLLEPYRPGRFAA